jgi:hypothetical protein
VIRTIALVYPISTLENMIKVILSNDEASRYVYFDVFDTNIARKWEHEIKFDYTIFENDRFTGWPDSIRTPKWYATELNKLIDIINEYQLGTINMKAHEAMDSDHANKLHKYFEILRGGVLTPAPFFTNSPEHVQQAIQDFNIMIHAFEKMAFSPRKSPTITCTFQCMRMDLEDEDYDHFTYDWKYGYMYINYCEVGKHLLEMFIDKDDIVGDDNIRPLKYYSADFKIKFGPDTPPERLEQFTNEFETWFDSNKDYFESINIHKDKYRALGLIPVAKINREASGFIGYTDQDIIEELSHYNKVMAVKSI